MGGSRPREADLRRAVSTMYYALFHALCQNCADAFVGTRSADRSQRAWRQVYRSVMHKTAKNRLSDQNVMKEFPKDIEDFGNTFVNAQFKRTLADYDPWFRTVRSEVLTDIATAEIAIRKLKQSPIKDRRALAVWVMLTNRNGPKVAVPGRAP